MCVYVCLHISVCMSSSMSFVLYICMSYVCMRVKTYTRMYIYDFLSICTRMYLYVYVYVSVYVYLYVCIRTCICVRIRVRICMCMFAYAHARVYVRGMSVVF